MRNTGGGFFIFCTIFYQNSPALTGLKDGKISHKPGNLLHSKSVDSAKVLRSISM